MYQGPKELLNYSSPKGAITAFRKSGSARISQSLRAQKEAER